MSSKASVSYYMWTNFKINLINSSYNKIKTQNHIGSGKKDFLEKKKIHFDSNFFRPFGATH